MITNLKQSLQEIYKRYGFEMSRSYDNDQVLVFTIKNGYFDNADIVKLSLEANPDLAFKQFTETGFACTIRSVSSLEQAEEQLFKGFFSIDSIRERLKSDYDRFTQSIVSPFSLSAKYEYINAPYQINNRLGNTSPAEEIVSRLGTTKPTLFLVEAAAGFGKTCTAYELVSLLIKKGEHLPLFSELSRNRQAVIFRYILLDEIDRSFPVLNARLVQAEMKNGRVITILDGFDELLRKSEEGGDFENKEPMLETIGDFLTGSAKIILTTRRTVLFEGDAFHNWIEEHIEDFDLIKIRINEPRVIDWLSESRLQTLKATGLDIENIANPVLLSYLRCISDEDFEKVSREPQLLVEKYFEFMFDREKTRQDLRIDSLKQQTILSSIAEDMLDLGYTSEQRDYIVDLIQSNNAKILDEALQSYPASERPTKEEISNKLASHALLDRSQREPNKIAFINEFVFGHFIGRTIINKDEWLSDDLRFIEPSVLSYQPRSLSAKKSLWEKLLPSLEFLPISDQLDINIRLQGNIALKLSDDEAQGLEIVGVKVGQELISNFQFNECTFKSCTFYPENFLGVTFLNCRFFENTLADGATTSGALHILGGTGDQLFIEALNALTEESPEEIKPDRHNSIEKFILEKFWPVGRDSIVHKHRPIKGVCVNNGDYQKTELYSGIDSLKKKKILLVPAQTSFIEINFDEILAIREILGRQNANGK